MTLALVLFFSSTATCFAANPIQRLHQARQGQAQLLLPGPAGWSLVRDVPTYQRLERQAAGAWRTITSSRYWSIRYVFGPYADQAYRVSSCEGTSVYSQNGQYLGIFQMGSFARSLYGYGSTYLAQARAAYRYFVASGRDWSPWQCKP
jgi:hypothetical protein